MVCAEDMAIIYGYEYEQTVGHGYINSQLHKTKIPVIIVILDSHLDPHQTGFDGSCYE